MSDNPVQRWHAHNPAATPTHADLKKGAAYAVGFADGHKQADRIEALTAALEKAVKALREIAGECGCSTARAMLAEIEGEKR
jgi:hypothetical protein